MSVHRDRRGHKALFISGVSANEYVPELARRHPPRLLRTYDGERFHDIASRRSWPQRRVPRPAAVGYRGL